MPCPPPRDLPDPGIKPVSLMSPALAAGFFINGATWEAPKNGPSSQITGIKKKNRHILFQEEILQKNQPIKKQAHFFLLFRKHFID